MGEHGEWSGAATGASSIQLASHNSSTTRRTGGIFRHRDWRRFLGPHSSSRTRSKAQPPVTPSQARTAARTARRYTSALGWPASQSSVARKAGSSGIDTCPAPPFRPPKAAITAPGASGWGWKSRAARAEPHSP
ncbi:MAG: hypothetical protein M3256_03875 [Actinomycetota bacterium]|nr:hypothetical protein [Actinomycetota bacterium]